MRPSPALILVAVLALGQACSEDKNAAEEPAEESAGGELSAGVEPATGPESGSGASASGGDESAGGKLHFTYPPEGAGPHEGFDLAALRDELQGAWLVGGTAFSNIPHVWHVRGDELTIVDAKGNRSEHTMRLLAPCYMEVANKADNLRVWHNFVLDGDTLYQGLGFSGVKAGNKTVGCMAAGVYVLDGDSCTKWTRKAFPRKGESMWDSEPGECGYVEDGKVFQGDDTNSKRKIYGVEKLNVLGDILLTKQMEANKAEKAAGFEAALAKQAELIKAKEELTKTPDLAFTSWGLPGAEAPYQKGDRVWAAAVNRQGKWSFNIFFFEKAEGDILHLRSMSDAWAPTAFVARAEPAAGLAKGAPVMVAGGAFVSYGRFAKAKGDKVEIESLSGKKVSPRELAPERIAAIEPRKWSLGAPAAYKDGDSWSSTTIVFDAGDQVYILGSDGVTAKPKAEVELVDVAAVHRKGTKVLAYQASGFAPLRFVPGKILQVHANGVAYTVKTEDGKKFEQSYDKVMKAK